MKHSNKDIQAADVYAGQFNRFNREQSAYKDFIAGCEHKQKEVDELIRNIENLNHKMDAYWNDSNKRDSLAKNICEAQRESYELIQKYKR